MLKIVPSDKASVVCESPARTSSGNSGVRFSAASISRASPAAKPYGAASVQSASFEVSSEF